MPVKIDGPAGRQEVTKEYRENYDRIFSRTSVPYYLYYNGKKVWVGKATSDGGKNDGKTT